ncbi:MAG TPA: hypothetical protein VJ953_20835 [Saprospiraceae bacterium]|nr:hypothetical protein [Saprospiraceae bacterium]
MKAARVSELKIALKEKSQAELLALTLRLAKFKKENKELLTYLLFESQDEEQYIRQIQEEITDQFEQITATSFYLIKKSVRKILRNTKTAIRYSQQKPTEVELLLHFVNELQGSLPTYRRSKVLRNLRERQLARIQKIIDGLHEDLQYDYQIELENLLADA